MAESVDVLEQRIDQLRAEVRRAVARGDRGRARALRSELRQAERDWHQASARLEELSAPGGGGQPESPRGWRASPARAPLLWRFEINIPGAAEGGRAMSPDIVVQAARAELAVHDDSDRAQRAAAARRARTQLDDVQQLFGSRLRDADRAVAGS